MLNSISHKIALSFFFITILAIGLVAISNHNVAEIRNSAQETISINIKAKAYIDSLILKFTEYFGLSQSALSLLDLNQQDVYFNRLTQLKDEIETEIDQVTKDESVFSNQLDVNLLQDLQKLHASSEKIHGYMQSFAQMQAMDAYRNEVVPVKTRILSILQRSTSQLNDLIEQRQKEIDNIMNDASTIAAATILVLVFVSIILGFLLWRSIIIPVTSLTAYLSDQKNLDKDDFPYVERKDEIGKFAQSFQSVLVDNYKYKTEIQQQTNILDAVIDNLPLAVIVKDVQKNFNYVKVNEKAEDLFGFENQKNIAVLNDFEVFPSEMANEIKETDDYIVKTSETLDLERVNYKTNFGNFIGRTRKVLISGLQSDQKYLMTVTEDITQKIQSEDQLNAYAKQLEDQAINLTKSKLDAERANNAKTDFLANMSHELRTPLNGILGLTQIIEQHPLKPEISDMFKTISLSASSLLNIVNDILDLSKIEAQEVVLEEIPFDVYDKITQIKNSLQPIANEKSIHVSLNLDKDHLYVFGDSLRFTKIMNNLISNAINYTENGSVNITAITKTTEKQQSVLRIEVVDSGIGISKQRIDKIFEKFTQADTSTTRRFGGTGLGLTITKQLVELMNGEIGVESVLGEGSTFWFEIPYSPATKADVTEMDPDNATDRRIEGVEPISVHDVRVLLAEDNLVNQNFMHKLFANLHIKNYVLEDNGEDALNRLRDEEFDLVLMDCHMPVMNGYDTTSAIRELLPEPQNTIPIIAMTANAMPEDKERCLSIGMNDYISKPVDIDNFKYILSPWIDFKVKKSRLKQEEQTAQKEKQQIQSAEQTAAKPEQAQEKTGNPPIDLTNLESNALGDQDFVIEMIALCIQQGDEQISQLKDLLAQDDEQEWREVSHALKGTAGSLGAEELRVLSGESQNLEEVSEATKKAVFKKIDAQYKIVKDYLIAEKLYTA